MPLHRLPPAPVWTHSHSLGWTIRPSFGLHLCIIPIRPRFEEPRRVELEVAVESMGSVGPWRRLGARWRTLPLWQRKCADILTLAILGVFGFGRLKTSGSMQKANSDLMMRIRQRAAIEIQDDFRAGLSHWTGPPGWANSWRYDATGFARPGRLALLSGSSPLADYRLEFLAEIDKRAVAWVFRAADSRNYYACKLMESKQGAGSAYSIVRYAVVDGRERMRVQLPLPVTASAKSLLRVRQEIRGDQFTTYLDGRIIDTWSDPALARGGFGFFADAGETAYIRWVDVAYQDDALGRLCAYLAPGKHD